MFNHVQGRLIEKSPTHAVIDCGGVGYFLNISLHTFSHLPEDELCKLYTHLAVREDDMSLYGFGTENERFLFRMLISVSGIGNMTGRMILSSLSPEETKDAISRGDAATIQSVKGIGAKTAQRVIIDLQDKIGRVDIAEYEKVDLSGNSTKREALLALSSLGFDKTKAEKTIDKILKAEGADLALEDLIKRSLKLL